MSNTLRTSLYLLLLVILTSQNRLLLLRATPFLTNGAHVAIFAAMAAAVLTQEIMTRETAQTKHATPTHPRRASLEHTKREEPH